MRLSITLVLFLATPCFAADEKDLNGTWLATEATQNGEKVADELVKSAKLVFTDGKYAASLGEVTENGTYKVDRSKKPNTLDWKATDGSKSGKQILAIFELTGDTFRMCSNLETGQRPKDFTSTAANKHFVVTYKRK